MIIHEEQLYYEQLLIKETTETEKRYCRSLLSEADRLIIERLAEENEQILALYPPEKIAAMILARLRIQELRKSEGDGEMRPSGQKAGDTAIFDNTPGNTGFSAILVNRKKDYTKMNPDDF